MAFKLAIINSNTHTLPLGHLKVTVFVKHICIAPCCWPLRVWFVSFSGAVWHLRDLVLALSSKSEALRDERNYHEIEDIQDFFF